MTAELSSINPNTSLRGVVLSLPVKPIKANVDLLGLIGAYGAAHSKAYMPSRGGRPDYWDDRELPDLGPITAEVERLQGCEYDLGEILETTTGVLLVLSRLQNVIAAMGTEEARAVARFADAVKEAQRG